LVVGLRDERELRRASAAAVVDDNEKVSRVGEWSRVRWIWEGRKILEPEEKVVVSRMCESEERIDRKTTEAKK